MCSPIRRPRTHTAPACRQTPGCCTNQTPGSELAAASGGGLPPVLCSAVTRTRVERHARGLPALPPLPRENSQGPFPPGHSSAELLPQRRRLPAPPSELSSKESSSQRFLAVSGWTCCACEAVGPHLCSVSIQRVSVEPISSLPPAAPLSMSTSVQSGLREWSWPKTGALGVALGVAQSRVLSGRVSQWWHVGRSSSTSHPRSLGIQLFAQWGCTGGRRQEGVGLN